MNDQDRIVLDAPDPSLRTRDDVAATGSGRALDFLQQRERDFDTLAEHLPDLVARFDRDNRFVYVNSAVERLTGASRQAMLGRTQRELGMPAAIVTLFEESLAEAARNGESHKLEFVYPGRSGARAFEAYHVPERDAAGEVRTVLCVARDITERKRAEQTLRDSETRLALAVDSTGLGLWDWDVRSGEVWRHPRWASILGYEPGEVRPHICMWREFCHPDDYPRSQERLMAHFEGKTTSYFADYRMRSKRGSWIWIGCRGKVIEREADGTPRRMIGYIRDISDRRAMEQALREGQEQFRAVTETANEAIVSADGKGNIIYFNQSAAKLFGYRVEEIIGESLTRLMPERFRAAHEQGVRRMLEGHPSSLAGKTVEFFAQRKDGGEFPIELSLAQWTTSAGVFFTGILRDISARRRASLAAQRSAALTQLLESLARAANEAVTPEAAMEAWLARICQHGGWVLGRVALFERERVREAAPRSLWYAPEPERERFARFIAATDSRIHRKDGVFIGRVLRERAPVWIEDMQALSGFRRGAVAAIDGIRAGFAFPIVVRGDVAALIEVFAIETRPADPLIMDALQTIASQLARLIERAWADRSLRESEERFRQLAENIREVFWINTTAGDNLIYVSPAYEEIWGRSCESLYANPRSWMEAIHSEDLPLVQPNPEKEARGEETDTEYRIIRPDGTVRWIRDRSYPMQQGDGTPLVFGIAEDITSRKRGEEERITHAFHQRDALVREVHHRIKNHLQGIAGLLRNKAADDPGAARTMDAAVAQLQSVAVVYGLQSELAESGVPLRRMLEAICASAEGLSAARVARRFPAAGGRLRLAETEAVPVAVALNELVFNAIEHGQRRAGSPAIEIALKEGRNGAEIRIVNRGRLPARFSYARGIGTGTGLDLVRTLLGPAGSALEYAARDGKVEVTLSLKEPLLAARKRAPGRRGAA